MVKLAPGELPNDTIPAQGELESAPSKAPRGKRNGRKPADSPREPDESDSDSIDTRGGSFSKFEKYDIVEVHRSQLKNAPYNPRILSPKARDKLRRNIERVGLIEPPIWNERTGNIVGGHQRVSILDSLEGKKDYRLRVARVDMDDKTEREQNIFLNNPSTQGDFDLEKLESMFRNDGVTADGAGFSTAELYQMFGDSPIAEKPDELMAMAESMREAKERMREAKEHMESDLEEHVDYFAVAVFESDADRDQFCDTVGADQNRYVDGRDLWTLLHSSGAVDMELVKGCFRTTIGSCPRCGGSHLLTTVFPLANPTSEHDHWAFCTKTCQPILIVRKQLADSDVVMVPDSELPETEEQATTNAAVAAVSGSATKGRTDSGRELENT